MNEATDDEDPPSGLERIVLFSDAVIAIAITLLVLEIRLPTLPEHAGNAEVLNALISIIPKIYTYAISFLVVGQFWYSHHLRFRFIRRYDLRLIWLNLLFLMAIGFVPFASTVQSEHAVPAAVELYDATMAVVALLSSAIWAYAIKGNRLISPDLDAQVRRQSLVSPLLVAAVFALAGVAAPIDVRLSHWLLLLVIPAAIGLRGKNAGHHSTKAS